MLSMKRRRPRLKEEPGEWKTTIRVAAAALIALMVIFFIFAFIVLVLR